MSEIWMKLATVLLIVLALPIAVIGCAITLLLTLMIIGFGMLIMLLYVVPVSIYHTLFPGKS